MEMEMEEKQKDEQRVLQEEEPEVNYRGVKAMPFIIGNETFEKLGAIGTISNLLVYLTTVFNMKSITATTLLNVFNGTTNFSTLLGAFLCDTYFGRYKTLGFASIASFTGLLLIDLTAVFKGLHPPECASKEGSHCTSATPLQWLFLLTGFALMIVGAAGIRPCNLAFGADQFNPKTESGKRGINSFFNWYFFTLTFAQMVSVTLVVYVQSDLSWSIGLAIPAIFMLISCFLFFGGTKIYVIVKPEGSPFTSMVRVVVVAVKKRRLKLPEQPSLSLFNYTQPKSINSSLPYSNQFRFLNKAAIVTPEDEMNPDGSASDPWKLCSIQQVEELKCVLKVVPIWTAAITYSIAMTQQTQYVVFQALQSDRRFFNSKFQIPAASYTVFTMLTLVIFVPIYDRLIVPQLRRITAKDGGISLLQRIGFGISLTVVASLISALVEEKRRRLALTKPTLGYEPHRGEISSMSAFWLIPQLSLAGFAESFTSIGLVEFYYKQFPENMRSVAGAFFFCGMAASSYLNGFLVTMIHRMTEGAGSGNWLPEDLNKGRLDYFYFLITVMGVLNLGYFLMCSRWYRYKESAGGPRATVEMEKKPEKYAV
ncbi:protein NRT1/ PTR FAMILY 2.9-like [Cynara cardunculus var. scolymus]|uniref:Major facilitator superfamily domain, general substrate transporter n=1 Tax=Cynara cardunculus var. scolymus TaxID=59895 RepID=A0A103YC38_CYNCS|nr:protein NRT1/ PTR FAMILY 2.9-like [Cynara cardunculus var. scolymus]KVI06368.1 Major facilitator superfamily domain, general substrate transporter [Cynara cardunculus var. scolymus]